MSEQHTKNWPDLAMGLYDRLTGSNAEITYEFEKMDIQVPSGVGENAEHAQWKLNGVLKVRTKKVENSPN